MTIKPKILLKMKVLGHAVVSRDHRKIKSFYTFFIFPLRDYKCKKVLFPFYYYYIKIFTSYTSYVVVELFLQPRRLLVLTVEVLQMLLEDVVEGAVYLA